MFLMQQYSILRSLDSKSNAMPRDQTDFTFREKKFYVFIQYIITHWSSFEILQEFWNFGISFKFSC